MRGLCFLLLFVISSLSAQFTEQKVEKLCAQIKSNQGMVLKIIWQNELKSEVYDLQLDRQRSYRIFYVYPGEENPAQVVLEVRERGRYDHRSMKSKAYYQGIACENWFVMTFGRAVATLRVFSSPAQMRCALIIASAGRLPIVDRTEVVDGHGNIFELSNSSVIFRNGKKFRKIRHRKVISLCVTPSGKLFMRTDRGDILGGFSLLVFRARHGRRAIKMVSGKSSVYILCNDGAVLNNHGYIIYKRKYKYRAVDLLEENEHVWLLTHEGRRQSLIR